MGWGSGFKNKLIASTVLAAASLVVYSRQAYAACVSTGVPPNYLCSGANAVTQTVTANNATVTTAAGFSVNAAAGNAITISGDGNLISFTDTNNSSIVTTGATGLNIRVTGNTGGTGSVFVDSNAVITGKTGILARNYGAGAMTITATGDVTGTASTGLNAHNGTFKYGGGTDLSINVNNVTGTGYGILASNFGTGALTLTATGDVTSTTGIGIRATNFFGTDMTVDAAKVTGNFGISAANYANGAITITASGDVTGTVGFGISASNYKGTSLSVDAAAVTGNTYGITAYNKVGSLTINATGDVTGTTQAGISVYNLGTSLSIKAATVTGGTRGIYAGNIGTGALTITATGDVTGATDDGIYARNSLSGTNLSIDAVNVTGASRGIQAINKGSGALTIVTTGDLAATTNQGIYARNFGTDLSIDAAKVSGGNIGLDGRNFGSGALTITANGDVSGNYWGIYSNNSAAGSDLSITTAAGTTTTANLKYGISARNDGSGALTITVDGDVTGGQFGIYARSAATGTDLSVTTGAGTVVTGTTISGVVANNFGNGKLTISADGDVTGNNVGIQAYNSATGTDISIVTGAGTSITGTNQQGIYARNKGTGALTITADGDVTGGMTGIHGRNYGTGTLTIAATGDVTGTANYGILAFNGGTGNALYIDAVNVSGNKRAIDARNYGAGALAVTATGDVTGTTGYGIYARNAGTDLSIDTFNVVGAYRGINARNFGTGALTITATGDVTGATGYGMIAFNSGAGTGLYIDAINVSGNKRGVDSRNYGTGALTITTKGDVAGASGYGIYARNSGAGLSIDVFNVDGYTRGISALNLGVGALTITTAGDVTGATEHGIYARNSGTDLSITTGVGTSVTATKSVAIYARNLGSGATDITNFGDVSGLTGIEVYGNGAVAGSLTNESLGTITGTGGTAISLRGLTASLPITINGGSIIGDVVDDAPSNGFSPVTIGGNFTTAGNFTVSSLTVDPGITLTLDAGDTLTLDNMPSSAGGTVALNVASNSSFPQIFVNGAGNGLDLTGLALQVNFGGGALVNGDEMLIGDGLAAITGGPGGTRTAVADNSFLWDFQVGDGTAATAATDASDLFLFAVQANFCSGAYTSGNVAACTTLQGLAGTPDPQLQQAISNMNAAPTAAAMNEVLESVQPAMDGGAMTASINTLETSLDLVTQWMDTIEERWDSGVSSGNSTSDWRGWGQIFGEYAVQDARGGIDGYDAVTGGFTTGMDRGDQDGDVLGMAISYGQTHVNSDNANSTETKVTNYQATVYGELDVGETSFVRAMGAYVRGEASTERHDVGGAGGPTAQGEYGSNQYTLRAVAGQGLMIKHQGTLTPSLLAHWTHYAPEGYTETGAGGANLTVTPEAVDILELGAGMNVNWRIPREDGSKIMPELNLGYRYDFAGDRVEATSVFAGGGAAFTSQGPEPARHRLNLGGEITYAAPDDLWEVKAGYNLDYKTGYYSHSAQFRSSLRF